MFDKLVVSTAGRRRSRTAKFFVCTSIVYLSIAALAFAGSIFFATPRLADTASSMPGLVFPTGGPKEGSYKTQKPVVALTKDPRNVLSLDLMINNLSNRRPPILQSATPPGPVVFGDTDAREGTGGPGISGIPVQPWREGSSGNAISEPPKLDPPKPAPRSVETDNKPLRVASIVLQGKVIERRVPVYPELARRIRLQGDVAVEVIISPEGRVESVRAVSGHPMLTQSALDAARIWRFAPTLLNGVPVRVTGVITFVFKLNE
jgi:periplasmic protein TonB